MQVTVMNLPSTTGDHFIAARNSLSELMIDWVLPCAVRTSSYVFDLRRLSNEYEAKTTLSYHELGHTMLHLNPT